jgi:DNA-binding SARP family transcriptional activator
MFGKLSVSRGDDVVAAIGPCKVQELLCYLLTHRDRPHSREVLAAMLWGDSPTALSKKYLRQALWQLQVAIGCRIDHAKRRTLRIETDWVQLDSGAGLWLDVAMFEDAYRRAQGMAAEALDDETRRALEEATAVYRGDLLDGWYQEWCVYERERLQGMYLTMLEKLMTSCEVRHEYEAGLEHGERVLRYDRAREATHRNLMRLRHLNGDRAGALRQYERCVMALREELEVEPAAETVTVHDQIRAGALQALPRATPVGLPTTPVRDVVDQLRDLSQAVHRIARELDDRIRRFEDSIAMAVPAEPPRPALSRHRP